MSFEGVDELVTEREDLVCIAIGKLPRLGELQLAMTAVEELVPERFLELFDLDADVGERVNLAKERPEVAKRMLERLRAWRKKTAKNENLHKHFGVQKPNFKIEQVNHEFIF